MAGPRSSRAVWCRRRSGRRGRWCWCRRSRLRLAGVRPVASFVAERTPSMRARTRFLPSSSRRALAASKARRGAVGGAAFGCVEAERVCAGVEREGDVAEDVEGGALAPASWAGRTIEARGSATDRPRLRLPGRKSSSIPQGIGHDVPACERPARRSCPRRGSSLAQGEARRTATFSSPSAHGHLAIAVGSNHRANFPRWAVASRPRCVR